MRWFPQIEIPIQTQFVLDEGTAEAIFKLKPIFKAKSFVGVIRRSIALARIAERHADKDGNVTLVDAKGRKIKVLLRS